jgi:hypothetical protein
MKPPAEGPGGWIAWKRHQKKIADQLAAKGKTANSYSYGKPPWRANPPRSIPERAASGYYHTRIPLFDDYDRKDAWILKGKAGASCTDTHKIVPNRELLQDLEMERFGAKGASRPHLMLLGLAADELGRLEGGKKDSIERFEEGINEEETYPLEDMKIKKSDEQRYLDALPGVDPSGRLRPGGFSDVKKSGCKFCKHQDKAQFWMLRELDPEFFKHVVALERRVVKKRGLGMAIFPRPLGTLIRGKPSALLQRQRHKPGREVSINPKDPSKSWVYTPLDVLVQEWEDAYVAKHGRRPDWEAVARKEYRGCAVAE